MKITDYEKVQALAASNIFLLDGPNGTKTIAADALAKALIGLLSSKDFIGGVNLSELTQINELVSGNKLLVGTTDGNKAIAAEDALFAMLDGFAPVELRRVLFRGKNLGTALTAVQKAAIKDGSFKGMFLGDYWSIGGRIWRIVDMDYWYNCGDTAFTSHHLVIMPDEALYNAQMNTTNVTTGGYVGSAMYKSNLANAKTIVNAAFQGSVLTHREYLCNAVANGRPSGGAWFDSSIELPNEPMMYGHPHFSPTSDGSTVPSIYTISKTQLALFMVCPRFIVNRSYNQWFKSKVNQCASLITSNVRAANTIYPRTMHEYETRRDYQNAAIVNCEQLINELQRVVEIFDVDLNVYNRYVKAIDREIGLIKRWRQRDMAIKSRLEKG